MTTAPIGGRRFKVVLLVLSWCLACPPVRSARESEGCHRRESQNHATRNLHGLSPPSVGPHAGDTRALSGDPRMGGKPPHRSTTFALVTQAG
jgi:hypothetical protein